MCPWTENIVCPWAENIRSSLSSEVVSGIYKITLVFEVVFCGVWCNRSKIFLGYIICLLPFLALPLSNLSVGCKVRSLKKIRPPT